MRHERAEFERQAAPQNAAQARGFVNQTLMAIGKLQKTPGDEVYIWAQDCLKMEPDALRKDGRFLRLDREIAAKLIKVCRHDRFGLLFQHMVESERLKSGACRMGAACCVPYTDTSSWNVIV